MGHWEQLGQDNAAERERRAKLPSWRRLYMAVPPIAALSSGAIRVAVALLLHPNDAVRAGLPRPIFGITDGL